MNELIFTNSQRAEVLTQALPYIRQYSGKIVVVKYGGNAMINEELKQQVMEDIVLLWLVGVKVVLVHGGGPEINRLMERLGKEPVFVDGLRVTDQETMDIVQMVLSGKINKTLVNLLEMQGGRAMGISGIDGGLIKALPKNPRLGYVGRITGVDIRPVMDMLEKGYIPVISTLGCDEQGKAYNINGDTAAAFIAGALGAWFICRSAGLDAGSAILATSPGGLQAVVGMASDLGTNAPAVLAFHLVRLYTVLLLAPFLGWLLHRLLPHS